MSPFLGRPPDYCEVNYSSASASPNARSTTEEMQDATLEAPAHGRLTASPRPAPAWSESDSAASSRSGEGSRGAKYPGCMPDRIRVACVQMTSRADKAANLEAAERLVTRAAATGADVVVLPEKWNA